MGFLDTNDTSQLGLPAGTHSVILTALKWVAKLDKGVAEFGNDDGTYTEWLNAASDGQKVRTRILVQHLCDLCGVKYRSPADLADFDALGAELVATATPLTITLVDDEYNGRIKTKLAGKFEDVIVLDTEVIGF